KPSKAMSRESACGELPPAPLQTTCTHWRPTSPFGCTTLTPAGTAALPRKIRPEALRQPAAVGTMTPSSGEGCLSPPTKTTKGSLGSAVMEKLLAPCPPGCRPLGTG